jgi:hypothetical protein
MRRLSILAVYEALVKIYFLDLLCVQERMFFQSKEQKPDICQLDEDEQTLSSFNPKTLSMNLKLCSIFRNERITISHQREMQLVREIKTRIWNT